MEFYEAGASVSFFSLQMYIYMKILLNPFLLSIPYHTVYTTLRYFTYVLDLLETSMCQG